MRSHRNICSPKPVFVGCKCKGIGIYAGCDMFLMPSRFEPCGLGQLIAMRYGAIPIVRHTGGLVDTVTQLTLDFSKGNGFIFRDYSPEALVSAIKEAVNAYNNKKTWKQVMQRIMNLDFSWQVSALKYDAAYKKVVETTKYMQN